MIACLAADCGWYLVGEKYGIRVLKTLCKISLEPDSCVSQTQTRFERWGVNSLVIAKFVPGLAIIAPPMAGRPAHRLAAIHPAQHRGRHALGGRRILAPALLFNSQIGGCWAS